MPRPIKNGLDYFPLDVNLDDKIALIEAEFGLTGFAVIVKLFQKIYGERGYYCEWTNEVALLFGHKNGLGGTAVSEIVSASIRRGIFDKNLFDKYSVLTSTGIQKRYFEAVNRRKQIEVNKQYLLIDVTLFLDNVNINQVNVNINSENDNNNSQRKVKESKEKKSNIYSSILDEFNRICSTLPKPQSVNENRRKAIKRTEELLNNNGLSFTDLFTKVNVSDFLSGRDGKWTGCNFDWILKSSNLIKIIEGNYDNKTAKPEKQLRQARMAEKPSYDIEELKRRSFLEDLDD